MLRATLVILLAVFSPAALYSQTSAEDGGTRQVQAQDGGTRQVLESIVIPPKANAPFLATLHTDWVRGSPDSGTFTLVNERRSRATPPVASIRSAGF